MMDINADFLRKFVKFFNKKSALLADKSALGGGVKIAQNKETNTLGNIWDADLTDIQFLSKSYKGICFSLCVIDIFSKYSRDFHLKDRKRYFNY